MTGADNLAGRKKVKKIYSLLVEIKTRLRLSLPYQRGI